MTRDEIIMCLTEIADQPTTDGIVDGISQQTIRDALELLKEQEPRVLTWDEVKQAEVCWVEVRGKEPYATLDAADWNPKYYGKEIRCWNTKPTKEQREEVKWDG